MANPLDVVTRFTSDVSGLQKGAGEAKEAIGGIGPASLLTSATVVGAAAVAVGAIIDLTLSAAKEQAQQELLLAAYKSSGAAVGDYAAEIDAAKEAGIQKGFSDEDTMAALQPLISATHDAAKANSDLKIAQDIARFAGVDLATAADAVAKAQAGQATQLTRLLPGLEKGKTATDTLANAQKLAAGASDTYAESTKGQMEVASASFDQLGQTIGEAFLPVLTALLPPLISIITLLGNIIKVILPPLTFLITTLVTVTETLIAAWIAYYTIGARILLFLVDLIARIPFVTTAFNAVATAIGIVVGWFKQLLDFVAKAIDAVGKLLDALNPLKGISLPSLPSLPFSAPAGASAGAFGTVAPYSVAGTVNVNVYGGDPRAVTRAVKDGFRRWTATEGKNAPGQDW